ncbi:hypothetical protein DFA_06434 [Cavenderia fasciculata]|uniref:Uncharacterized protein n=1 Tax=Cavenderia fasciculata TaxID=261658 RepID=F4PIZ8_CACFS|nr:uncharacterized protein DFA_06434 [Cavenderia fasciculata]EGG24284.1 hypothetical protein DFA_06434 [Cavenderia fasciculata]|eukprot:XP_004362135.1 hypothetical protein DFA_06434 [Cavenderia fasciculata]
MGSRWKSISTPSKQPKIIKIDKVDEILEAISSLKKPSNVTKIDIKNSIIDILEQKGNQHNQFQVGIKSYLYLHRYIEHASWMSGIFKNITFALREWIFDYESL